MKLNTHRRFTALVAALLMIVILVSGCSNTKKLSEGVVAIVDGTEISEEEYNKLLDYYLSVARQYNITDDMLNKDEGGGMTLLDNLKTQILDTIVLTELIAKKAAENNIKVDEKELQQAYEEGHIQMMEKDENYKKLIEENNISEDFIKEQVKTDLLGYKYREFYLGDHKIADEAAKAFYDENSEIFSRNQVKAKHILVSDENLAKDIAAKLEAGEDFETLAKEHSEDPSVVQNGGQLGFFSKGEMVPEFEEAAFSLEIGKVSEPVKSSYGYHIIIVEEKIDETTSFEDAKQDIKDHLANIDFEKHINELLENANVIKKDKL